MSQQQSPGSDRVMEAGSANSSSRRRFIQAAGVAAGATALGAMPGIARAANLDRRRYAIVGTGGRGSGMWGRDVVAQYADVLEFVGLCDINPKRVEAAKKIIGVDCPTFTEFDKMCDQVKPELVAITTVDAHHAGYIIRALDRGIDVLTEKPMVINEQQCRDVLAAEKRNNRRITVTHNYRYAPKHRQIKELLMSGVIGKVLSVDFSWYLDQTHGADYFRRWHRLRACSGSLWVHKASHHFDLVNWWLDAEPVDVVANAELKFYGKAGPHRGVKCRGCPNQDRCDFYWDMTRSKTDMALYAGAEDVDGYFRDGCVFREDIDIFDKMTALVNYTTGATMTYSLNAFLPIEGYRIAFNGDRGRLEIRDLERQPWKTDEENEVMLARLFGPYEKVKGATGKGDHGGGDTVLKDIIFRDPKVPRYMRLPSSRAGAMSCLTGIAARKSIDEQRRVSIKDLLGEA